MTSTRLRFVWLLAYAFISLLSFPHVMGKAVVDLGLLAAWFGPGCLILALRGQAPRAAAGTAFVGGWLAHVMILHWIYVVTVRYGHAPGAVGVIAVVLIAVGVAGHLALFGAGWAWLASRRLANPFSAAALWTGVEYLRSFIVLGGFPWATLGYTQHQNTLLLPLAQFTGVYGLSFVVALVSAALAEIVAMRKDADPIPAPATVPVLGVPMPVSAIAGLACALLLHGAGALILVGEGDEESDSTLRMAALQGDIDQGVKWDPRWAEQTLRIYEDLSRQAAGQGARLIVWPETAVPSSILTDSVVRQRLSALAIETRATLVVGGVGIEVEQRPEGRELRYFDSAFLFDTSGALRARYDKAHLVPFGEYVPLQGLVGSFLKAIAAGISLTGITPGVGPRALDVRGLFEESELAFENPDGHNPLTLGVPICYELVFPDIVRRMARDGASVLLGITNDAWYGRTGAPYQFLAMTALRSAENRLWTVRAANSGVSAIIDGRGRVREQTPIFERGLLVYDVPLRPEAAGRSWYARFGDLFARGCLLAIVALALAEHFARARGANEAV
jgi:apolipoprotein N-acyltransferase